MNRILVGLIFFSISALGFAQDYSLNIPVAPKKTLAWSGNLDGKYSAMQMRSFSPFYKLQFSDGLSDYFSQYRLELYLNADYRSKNVGFHLKTHGTYYNDSNAQFDLFEAYGNYNPSLNTTLHFGKQMFNWGKGYAFNPAGFVNPYKDPENPELAHAGLLSMSFETIKSFQNNWLKTVALTAVVIPPAENINNRYAETENTDFAIKGYSLLRNTDVDVMAYFSRDGSSKYGADFSQNLKENIEIHGEFAYSTDETALRFKSVMPTKSLENGYSWLAGLRYLNRWNTTIIAEYYRNDFGWTQNDYSRYFNLIENNIMSDNLAKIPSGMTQMQDYLYLKISQPEPFNLLYFSPSIYTIYNLQDRSIIIGAPMTYSPVSNFSMIFWPTFISGKKDSEFGSKPTKLKFEIWMRFYF